MIRKQERWAYEWWSKKSHWRLAERKVGHGAFNITGIRPNGLKEGRPILNLDMGGADRLALARGRHEKWANFIAKSGAFYKEQATLRIAPASELEWALDPHYYVRAVLLYMARINANDEDAYFSAFLLPELCRFLRAHRELVEIQRPKPGHAFIAFDVHAIPRDIIIATTVPEPW